MKKNQLTTTKSTSLILGKSKSLMGITKKILEGKSRAVTTTTKSQELVEHDGITIIGDLMWEKETQEKMKWDDAMEYAKNLRLGGYDDWRMPTIEELGEVVTLCGGVAVTIEDDDRGDIWDKNKANENYQANYKVKGFTSSAYWSSTTYAVGAAWIVDFYDGRQSVCVKSYDYYVRCVCVRSGQ